MSKIITAIAPRAMGHLQLDFDDGTTELVARGEHEQHDLKVGDTWPVEIPADQPVGPAVVEPAVVEPAAVEPAAVEEAQSTASGEQVEEDKAQ